LMSHEFHEGPQLDAEPPQESVNLPDDPRLRERLETKVKEYQGRVDEREQDLREMGPHSAPELVKYLQQKLARAHMKQAILQDLLNSKTIQYFSEKQRLSSLPGFTDEAFDNAYAVIADYAQTGGEFVARGTGLKWFEQNHQS